MTVDDQKLFVQGRAQRSGLQCAMVDWRLSGRHQDEKMLFLSKNRILTQKIFSLLLIWSRSFNAISFELILS